MPASQASPSRLAPPCRSSTATRTRPQQQRLKASPIRPHGPAVLRCQVSGISQRIILNKKSVKQTHNINQSHIRGNSIKQPFLGFRCAIGTVRASHFSYWERFDVQSSPPSTQKGLASGRVVAVGLAELVNEPMKFLQILDTEARIQHHGRIGPVECRIAGRHVESKEGE